MDWKKYVNDGMDMVKAVSQKAMDTVKDPEFREKVRQNGTDLAATVRDKVKDPELRDRIRQNSAELAATVKDKVKDEEFRKETAKKAKDTFMEVSEAVADLAISGTQKTVEYVEKKRMTPGAKDQYIQELEEKLEKKEKEVRTLRRKLARKNWSSRR